MRQHTGDVNSLAAFSVYFSRNGTQGSVGLRPFVSASVRWIPVHPKCHSRIVIAFFANVSITVVDRLSVVLSLIFDLIQGRVQIVLIGFPMIVD